MVGDTEARLGTAAIVFIMLCVVGTCVMIGRQGQSSVHPCAELRGQAKVLTALSAEEHELGTPEAPLAAQLAQGAWSRYAACRMKEDHQR